LERLKENPNEEVPLDATEKGKLNRPDVEPQLIALELENSPGKLERKETPELVLLPVRLKMAKIGEQAGKIGTLKSRDIFIELAESQGYGELCDRNEDARKAGIRTNIGLPSE